MGKWTWHLVLIKEELWRLIFTPCWQLIDLWLVSCGGCGRMLQLSLTHVNMLPHLFTPFGECGDEGMTLLNSCQVLKSWPCLRTSGKQLNWSWVDQLNRVLALHDLVKGLGICWATFGLKVSMLLSWVRFRPGIWDSGAISSTGCGAVWDRLPLKGV